MGSLKLARTGIFIPRKMAIAKNQLAFSFPGEIVNNVDQNTTARGQSGGRISYHSHSLSAFYGSFFRDKQEE